MLIEEYDSFYSRLIMHSKRFIKEHARASGSFQKVLNGEGDVRFLNDYRYFTFTKSTKTLIGIYELLRLGNYEDVLTLSRMIFECYISERYFDDKYGHSVLNSMVVIPKALSDGLFYYNDGAVVRRDTNDTLDFSFLEPGALYLGKDKSYSPLLYSFLCEGTHCNISQFDSFLDENRGCVLYSEKNAQAAHFIPLFVFSKLFENVVLLESTKYSDKEEEKECTDLLIELTEFMIDRMEKSCEKNVEDALVGTVSVQTVRKMINSLSEQLGRVDKSFVEKFKLRYVETAAEKIVKPVLLTSQSPSAYFEEIKSGDKFGQRLIELKKLIGYVPEHRAICGSDAWEHTMMLLDRAVSYRAGMKKPYAFMLAVLTCAFEASDTGKSVPGRQNAERLLSMLTNSPEVKQYVMKMIELKPDDIIAAAVRENGG